MSTGQIVGGVVGAVVGFFTPIGPVYGAQIGMLLGGAIDPPKGPVINGPRLSDLSVQTSTYGAFIPRNYGTIAQSGNVFWLQGDKLTEVKTTTSGGKGGPSTTTNSFSYYATFAVGLCEGPIDGISRIWIGGQLWYDAGSSDVSAIIASNAVASTFTLYTGTDTQLPDPLIQADRGVANTPAYRGIAYIVFNSLPLAKYSNSLLGAQVKVEIIKNATFTSSVSLQTSTTNIYGPNYPLYMSYLYPSAKYMAVNATSSNGIYIYDIYSQPIEPVLIGYFLSNGNEQRTFAYGNKICAAGNLAILYDATSNTSITLPFACYDIATDGAYIYAISLTGYLYISDFAGVLKSTLYIGGTLIDIATSDGYVYIVNQTDSKIYAVNAIDVIAPALVWTISSVPYNEVLCNSTHLYARQGATIHSYKINGISTPTFLSSVNANGYNIVNISLDGDFILCGSGSAGFQVVDVSNPDLITRDINQSNSVASYAAGMKSGYIYISGHQASPAPLQTWYLKGNIISSNSPLLSTVIDTECLKSNLLTAPDIDTTEMTDSIRGYRVSSMGAIRGGIDPLRAAWPFDVVQTGYKIKFKKRGSASVVTINADEMDARAAGENAGVQITNSREMDTILPQTLKMTYLDTAREYDTNEQISTRGL